MENEYFFTIIIPTFNRAGYIEKTVRSAVNQNFSDFEIIVVDDGSTDSTEEIVSNIKSEKVKYYRKKNEERSIARNYGIERAGGRYVTFLDSDDILFPDFLKFAHETLEKNNFPEFLNCSYLISDTNGKILERRILTDANINVFIKGNPFSCIGNFVRKDVLREYKFNENPQMITSEDWELWVRIASRYGYIVDPRAQATLIDHSTRSVRKFSPENLIMHKQTALYTAIKDPYVKKYFQPHFNKLRAHNNTYISLHLALSGKKLLTIKYLFLAFIEYPLSIFNRRFLAIIKHLLITW